MGNAPPHAGEEPVDEQLESTDQPFLEVRLGQRRRQVVPESLVEVDGPLRAVLWIGDKHLDPIHALDLDRALLRDGGVLRHLQQPLHQLVAAEIPLLAAQPVYQNDGFSLLFQALPPAAASCAPGSISGRHLIIQLIQGISPP
jgi:hypothetical protein